jgi:chromosome segregation ATPase
MGLLPSWVGDAPSIVVKFKLSLESQMADADLNFLARQNERILTEIGSLRDDMTVLTAMVMRLDGSHSALLQETRATHAQISRMNDRIRKLEDERV